MPILLKDKRNLMMKIFAEGVLEMAGTVDFIVHGTVIQGKTIIHHN